MSASNASGHYVHSVPLTSATLNAQRMVMRIDNSCLVMAVSNVKLEKGNKATDWTPAPEDMATQAGMESRISNEISTISDDFTGQLGELSGMLSGLDESLRGLEGAIAADKTIRDNWIQMDKDGIFVGSQSEAADYGVGIDADSVDFMVGGERAAYASAAAFVPKALRLGDYVLSGSGGYLYIDYDPLT